MSMKTKDYARFIPTDQQFKQIAKGSQGSVGKVYYYLLSCAVPHIDYTSGNVLYLETSEETTGKRVDLCNRQKTKTKPATKGVLKMDKRTYQKAIEKLTQPLTNEDGEPIKDEQGRLFRLLRHKQKKGNAYWTDFEIGKINVPGFAFQKIKSQTLKDLALRDNKYVVQMYAHLLYLCYDNKNKKYNYKNVNHPVCPKYFWKVILGTESISNPQKKEIANAFTILQEMGLFTGEHVRIKGLPYTLVKDVFLEVKKPEIREMSDDELISQYNYKTHETRKITVGEAFSNRKADRKAGWLV